MRSSPNWKIVGVQLVRTKQTKEHVQGKIADLGSIGRGPRGIDFGLAIMYASLFNYSFISNDMAYVQVVLAAVSNANC